MWEFQIDFAPTRDEFDTEERQEQCLIILEWSGCQDGLQPARGVQSDRTLEGRSRVPAGQARQDPEV